MLSSSGAGGLVTVHLCCHILPLTNSEIRHVPSEPVKTIRSRLRSIQEGGQNTARESLHGKMRLQPSTGAGTANSRIENFQT